MIETQLGAKDSAPSIVARENGMKNFTLVFASCMAIGTHALGQAPMQAPAQPLDAPSLFTPAQAPPGASLFRGTRSSMAALPDLAAARSLAPEGRLILNVAPGRDLVLVVERVDLRSPDSFSVRGYLEGFPGSWALLAVEDDALACDISAPGAGIHYRTRYAGEGVHLVCEVDATAEAPCGPSPGVYDGPREDPVPETWELEIGELPEAPPDPTTGACVAPVEVFDVMIVYTDTARIAAGSAAAIHSNIQLAIDEANFAYDNSPISARMRLIRRYEVSYNEVGTYEDHLNRLTSSGSGIWPGIRSERDQANADFCVLFVNDTEYCGLAWCVADADSAYGLVTWDCSAIVTAHEIGHNQGCQHDPSNADCSGSYSYSFGHRFDGSDGVEYRTVMAYSPGTRIPYFSNPDRNYLGTPTGTATRNNETTIDNRSDTCENFELTRWDIWVEIGADPIVEIGTFTLPYDTFPEGVTNLMQYNSGWGASEYPNLYLKEGSTAWTGTVIKPMTLIPCGGAFTLGD